MMNREELERMIVDASDGVLSAGEIRKLEEELQKHPDLFRDYQAIMRLPDFTNIYQVNVEAGRHQSSIHQIRKSIRNISSVGESFEVITLNWFRRYALAASLAIFAITSLYTFMQPQNDEQVNGEEIVEELFYPVEESSADSYVLYLEDLTEE